VSVSVLRNVAAALVSLVVLVFAAVLLLAARRRHREREHARLLPAARTRIRTALARALAEDAAIDAGDGTDANWATEATDGLPDRLRIALFEELAAALSGAQRDRLLTMAQASGVSAQAEMSCRSRRWWRRLQGVRLHALIGGGEQTVPFLLEDSNTEVRAAAAAWSARDTRTEAPGQLIEMLGDEQPLVRFAAQGALLVMGRRAVEPLAAYLTQQRDPSPQQTDPPVLLGTLQVAVSLHDMRLLAPACAYSEDRSPAIRATLAELAGAVGGEQSIALLLAALGDPCADVRGAAAQGLGRLGYWPAGPQLLAALSDKAWVVRQRAGVALRDLGAPGVLLLRRGLRESDPFARDMAHQVLDLPDTDRQAALV
jgi:HEAT repeats